MKQSTVKSHFESSKLKHRSQKVNARLSLLNLTRNPYQVLEAGAETEVKLLLGHGESTIVTFVSCCK